MSQNLALVLRARGDEGEVLPSGIPRLAQLGAKCRRGSVSLWPAAPGGGKTSLMLWESLNAFYPGGRGVPTLYFSADCDRVTVGKTVVAGLLGINQDQAERLILAEDDEAYSRFGEASEHIWWCFEPNPSLQEMKEEIEAYAFVHGEYPHKIVVDNIMDIPGGGSSLESDTEIMMFLSNTARKTGAHVMALAHVKGPYGDGAVPIPKSGVLNNIDKKARLMVTLYRPNPGVMGLRVVKNTSGPASPDATFGIDLAWIPEKGWFSE